MSEKNNNVPEKKEIKPQEIGKATIDVPTEDKKKTFDYGLAKRAYKDKDREMRKGGFKY